jgi:hypothetical protein
MNVGPFGSAELVVDERTGFQQPIDWLQDLADIAVKGYLADPRSDQGIVGALSRAWVTRDELKKLTDEHVHLTTEQSYLQRSTQETRFNLKALEKNKHANDLVQKLTDRLRRDSDRLDVVTKRLIEVDVALREQDVRFRDAIRDIRLVNPPPANAEK